VNIHTDTLNESGFVESPSVRPSVILTFGTDNTLGTIAAFGGRTIHTYHTEGAGRLLSLYPQAEGSACYKKVEDTLPISSLFVVNKTSSHPRRTPPDLTHGILWKSTWT